MQIKTTMSYHCTPVRVAIIKIKDNKSWQRCREIGILAHSFWKCMIKQYSSCGNNMDISQEIKIIITMSSGNSTSGISKELK